MRVIAGAVRGRRLQTVAGSAVRPTADRVKEAIFSMLASRQGVLGVDVLDLYAGSGALGIEALSRGAASAVFVDRDAQSVATVRDNLSACRFAATVILAPALGVLEDLAATDASFGLVFLDPPYASSEALESLAVLGASKLLRDGAFAVVEHAMASELPENLGSLRLTTARHYGKTAVSLYGCELGEI